LLDIQKLLQPTKIEKSVNVSPRNFITSKNISMDKHKKNQSLRPQIDSKDLKKEALSKNGMKRSVNLTESLLDVFAEKKVEYFKKFTIRLDYDSCLEKSHKLLEDMCDNEDHFIGRLAQFHTQLQKRKRSVLANNVKFPNI